MTGIHLYPFFPSNCAGHVRTGFVAPEGAFA
jgi:hypothetical protein